MIKALQYPLRLGVFRFDSDEGGSNEVKEEVGVASQRSAVFAFAVAEVLDFLAGVFDFSEADGRG